VELGRIPDRYIGSWKNFQTGEFFRVTSVKSVIRCEYFYNNRYISTIYVGIKHLFGNFKVLKNLERCDRDCGTWKNSRPVRRDLEKFPDRLVFSSYFLEKRYKVRKFLQKPLYLDKIRRD
jgi:hypothetical protein